MTVSYIILVINLYLLFNLVQGPNDGLI